MTDCKHWKIRTWVYEDTKEPCGLWSCLDCDRRFEPLIVAKRPDGEGCYFTEQGERDRKELAGRAA